MTRIFLFILVAIGLSAAPAQARQSGGFPDILGDIFGGKPQAPYGAPGGMTYIENIPVQLTFDSRPDLLPPEATLVVTAIAPPPANVRRAKPLVMGETRILISRLAPPLSLVIAVPSDLARDTEYARIEAKIIDANGNVAFRLENSAEYRGGQPPFLELIPTGAFSVPTQAPVQTPIQGLPPKKPGTGGPMLPYTPPNINVIKASVELPAGAQLMRGSVLVLQVTENDLAGGFGASVVHEQRVEIDQKQPPFAAKLNVPTGQDGTLEQPELVAWIEDWAGRKTFVRVRPVSIPASGDVVLRLDPILTGQQALPPEVDNYVAPPGVNIKLTGTAEFEAFKGLPSGALLTVSLRDASDYTNVIKSTSFNLNGLSGYVDFAMDVDAVEIENRNPAPLITAEITDSRGEVLFSDQTLREVSRSKNIIRLLPTGRY